MQTECSADLFGFARVEGRAVVAVFNGGKIPSDAGALLLGMTDRAILLVDRFAACFADRRTPELIEHTVGTLVGRSSRIWHAGSVRSAITCCCPISITDDFWDRVRIDLPRLSLIPQAQPRP